MRSSYLQLCDYGSRFRILKGGKISLVVSAFIASTTLIHAAPTGGVVTSGTASIASSGLATNITQSSQKASINWNTFSIGATESVNFNQPNVSAITLNRVVGNEKSIIDGALNANGQVWILNSNGVLFNNTASINTSGLLATTKNLSDENFQAGNYTFKGDSTASVINLGEINIANSGYASLLANSVSNEGTITAIKGKVTLTGANEATINLNGNSLVNLTVTKGALDALVENKGAILADGGEIYLTTNAVNELLRGVVNNTGIVEARTLDDVAGKIELFAHGGEVKVGGALNTGENEGFIETSGDVFSVLPNTTVTTGFWLIDPPSTLHIDASLASTLQGQLSTGDASATSGEIEVDSDISWSAHTLTLDATAINVNAVMSATGTAGLTMTAAAPNIKMAFNPDGTFKGRVDFLATGNLIINSTGYTRINDLNGLQSMGLSGAYYLGSNIDASATAGWNGGLGFDPIGDSGTPFNAIFNGLGHNITGLTINRPALNDGYDFGLIGKMTGGVLQNLSLVNASITGYGRVGGFVGNINGSAGSPVILSNISISGTVSAEQQAGGLVGYDTYGIISNSHSSAAINGTMQEIGGLVGYAEHSSISNSYATGTVRGDHDVGGLVGGFESSGTISDSYATGGVTSTSTINGSTGGLAGYFNGSTLSNSYATGNVQGFKYIGGLIGESGGNTITNSYATGDVTATENSIGGLIGYSSSDTIATSYATGDVRGVANVGGLVGTTNYSNIANSYATGTVNGTSWNVGGLIGSSDGDSGSLNGNITSSYATGRVISTGSRTGGLVGFLEDGSVTDSYATGDVDGAGQVGGLVGYNYRSTISNSHAVGNIIGTSSDVGGLIGYSDDGVISQSYATGNVSGDGSVGGFVGESEDSTITNSFTTGNVISTNSNVGGFVGYSDTSSITTSYATGNVNVPDNGSPRYSIGGFAGNFDDTALSLSYASGNVIATNSEDVGGLVGYMSGSSISNSYATGSVSGTEAVGGLVGYHSGTSIDRSYATGAVSASVQYAGGLVGVNDVSSVTNSYWDIDSTGQVNGFGHSNLIATFDATGIHSTTPTANAFTQATYNSALNFGINWFMIDGYTRPFLRMEHTKAISNDHQLQLMAMDLIGNYTLEKDITMGSTMWKGGNFSPIGNTLGSFNGSFDGKSHTISDLTIVLPSQNYVGLFGWNNGSFIKDIGLLNVTIEGHEYVGGLAGAKYQGTVTNSYVRGNVEGDAKVGGLIGLNQGDVDSSYSTASVNSIDTFAGDYVGGLIGANYSSTISNSYATGYVSGGDDTGGLIGYVSNSIIRNSYATGGVYGPDYEVGGLIGFLRDGSLVINSHATGNVSGNDEYIGGLVARVDTSSRIEQSYARGNVTGLGNADSVGGLVGEIYNASISNSYATGNIIGQDNVGGLVGLYGTDSSVDKSYALGTVTGATETGGLLGKKVASDATASYYNKTLNPNMSDEADYGKTTEELQTLSTFTGWDIVEDATLLSLYPVLSMSGSSPVWKIKNVLSGGETPPPSGGESFQNFDWYSTPNVSHIENGTAMQPPLGRFNPFIGPSGPLGGGQMRLPSWGNGVMALVNGGVNLPDGLEQLFFNTQE